MAIGAVSSTDISQLQKQLLKDTQKLAQDSASKASQQQLQLDQLAVQADQAELTAAQQSQQQASVTDRTKQAAPGLTASGTGGSGTQPGTVASDGSVYM